MSPTNQNKNLLYENFQKPRVGQWRVELIFCEDQLPLLKEQLLQTPLVSASLFRGRNSKIGRRGAHGLTRPFVYVYMLRLLRAIDSAVNRKRFSFIMAKAGGIVTELSILNFIP